MSDPASQSRSDHQSGADSTPSLHAIVHGRVQGVGFRYFVRTEAERLGLGGTVRNRRDGSVEVRAAGPRDALDALLAGLHRGPMLAKVTRVDTDWDAEAAAFTSFQVTHDAD